MTIWPWPKSAESDNEQRVSSMTPQFDQRQIGRRNRTAAWLSALGSTLVAAMPVRAALPVEAELVIPSAETHVIGDTIPLYWRFRNVSAEPLGFMWEGCCRLNGRLTVTLDGKPIEPIPPGQALAHMFAKAERLDPGQARDFDTRLSDWVRLPRTGAYELRGRYTGVLPDQQPQVPRGTRLWREAAETGPIQIGVIGVDDYLARRESQARARGLTLTLTGPASVPALGAGALKLQVTNRGSQPGAFAWPDSFQLWVVAADGTRVALSSAAIEDDYAPVTLAPAASFSREIPLQADQMEGEAFGDYRVFVDLAAATNGVPRVPSNAIPMRWNLGPAEVADLLTAAAGGQRTGARNAPLKLLRVYVAELGPVLAGIEPAGLPPEAQTLRAQLARASAIKPVAPVPGRVNWTLNVTAEGAWNWADPRLAMTAKETTADPLAQVGELLALRRHLGWEVVLAINPDAGTPLGRLFALADQFGALRGDLADLMQFVETTDAPTNRLSVAAVVFDPVPVPASVVIRARSAAGGMRVELAAREPNATLALIRPEELGQVAYRTLAASGLAEVLAARRSPVVLVLSDDAIPWRDLRALIQPALARGLRVHVTQAR